MTIRRFFCSEKINDGLITIEGEEVHHICSVNRLRDGSNLEITDGMGWVHQARIESFNRDRIYALVIKSHFTPKPPSTISIAISLLKGKAMNLVIERLSEIGVHRISPIIFDRTDAFASDEGRSQKWTRIAEQAIKVSDNPWLPVIDDPISVNELLKKRDAYQSKILLDLDEPYDLQEMGKVICPALSLIGPPGGITKQEQLQIKESGFKSVRISQWTLRSETAAIVVAAWLNTSMTVATNA